MIPNDDASVSFTRIPNSVLDWLLGPEHDLSFRQVRVLLAVFRFTYGFSRRSAPLSSRYLAEYTGINQAHVCRTLKSLVDEGLLAVSFERKIGFYTLCPRRYKNKKERVVDPADDALSASRCSFGHETDALSASKIERRKREDSAYEPSFDGLLPEDDPSLYDPVDWQLKLERERTPEQNREHSDGELDEFASKSVDDSFPELW